MTDSSPTPEPQPPRTQIMTTVVLRKTGRLVYLGHRDFARSVQRALRRSGLPLRMTEGFHPHPKLMLPEPLPLGVGSDGERFIVYLEAQIDAEDVASALSPVLPEGMELVDVIDGKNPELLDITVELLLTGSSQREWGEAIGRMKLDELGLRGLRVVERDPALVVQLEPPEGRRVSVGRFLRALKAAVPGDPPEVLRRS